MEDRTKVLIREIHQEWRWNDLSRPAFLSERNRGEIMRLLHPDDIERFEELVKKYDRKKN